MSIIFFIAYSDFIAYIGQFDIHLSAQNQAIFEILVLESFHILKT